MPGLAATATRRSPPAPRRPQALGKLAAEHVLAEVAELAVQIDPFLATQIMPAAAASPRSALRNGRNSVSGTGKAVHARSRRIAGLVADQSHARCMSPS